MEHPELPLLQEVEFTLNENGDVEWKCPDSKERLPLFDCDTFEVLREREGFAVVVLLRFGAWKGCIVEFLVENEGSCRGGGRVMVLRLEGWATLTCSSVRRQEAGRIDTEFHFLPGLEHGLFSDLVIESRSKMQYHVHKIILNAEKINTDEQFLRSSFYGFSDEVTQALLHYIYSRCLPPDLTLATAGQLIEFSRNQPNFNRLGKLCESFIKNRNFQSEMVQLVNDMHLVLNQTLLLYGGKTLDENGKEKTPRNRALGRTLITNPAKLCSVIKQTFTNFLLVGLKIVQFCEKFVKFKSNLTKQDQIAVFMFAKAQLPVFIGQIRELCKSLKLATADMDAAMRYDIASYFVPELEELMSAVTNFGLAVQDVHQKVIEATCQAREYNMKAAKFKPRPLRHILITKEILYMKSFDDRLGVVLSYLIYEREGFIEQPAAERIRDISRQIEQLVDEIPFTIHKLLSFSNILQEKLDLESFKFCFTVAASLIAELLEKYRAQRRHIKHFLTQLTAQLQNEKIEECLVQLGLLESPVSRPPSSPRSQAASPRPAGHPSPLDLTKEFSRPVQSTSSSLAQHSLHLLQSLEGADMEFEIRDPVSPEDGSNSPRCPKSPASSASQHSPTSPSTSPTTILKAHRVIVSSRCPWFRRALNSGMKESIERRIVLHDCSLPVFRCFLQFLYSGLYRLDLGQEQPQFLADLLLIADRYEVDQLKDCCEEALLLKVDSDSCMALLVLSDQFQAGKLRRACFDYIAQRPPLCSDENLAELPKELREELSSLGAWVREGVLAGGRKEEGAAWRERGCLEVEKSKEVASDREMSVEDRDLREVEHLTENMRVTPGDLHEESLALTTDGERLEACVAALREVLGPLVPEEAILQVALSADCNTEQALNSFFHS